MSQDSHQEGCVLNPGVTIVFNVDFCFSERKGTKRFSYKKAYGVDDIERREGPSRVWTRRSAALAGLKIVWFTATTHGRRVLGSLRVKVMVCTF